MNNQSKTAADYTDRPELYRATYWGRDPDRPRPEIIENRNRMADEYGLTTPADTKPALVPLSDSISDWELIELYRDREGGFVLVCSSYCLPPPPALGMQQIPSIYALYCKSWLARFPSLAAMRKAFAQATRERWGGRWGGPEHESPEDTCGDTSA